jgi:radical SAM superfamily enzyme with C-terminal helix-hairpin-helix motif
MHFVRQVFDVKMLQRITPPGTVLRGLWAEECSGGLCYARQAGSYPLMVVLKGPLPRLQYLPEVRVTGVHSSRSLRGEVIGEVLVGA